MKDYISIKVAMDNLLHHPLLQDLTFERVVNYTQQFIQIVGIKPTFINKVASIDIKDYRGVLPCDLQEIVQVRTTVERCGNIKQDTFRASTDTFHFSPDKKTHPELTYKIQGGCIFTSMKEGTIEIAYDAIATDQEGYPLVPDNAAFIRALESYIKVQHFTILFDLGKINAQVYHNAQQEYAWNVGQAQSSMIMPTLDEMQAITNSLNTHLVRTNEHSRGFIDNGTMERIKIH